MTVIDVVGREVSAQSGSVAVLKSIHPGNASLLERSVGDEPHCSSVLDSANSCGLSGYLKPRLHMEGQIVSIWLSRSLGVSEVKSEEGYRSHKKEAGSQGWVTGLTISAPHRDQLLGLGSLFTLFPQLHVLHGFPATPSQRFCHKRSAFFVAIFFPVLFWSKSV